MLPLCCAVITIGISRTPAADVAKCTRHSALRARGAADIADREARQGEQRADVLHLMNGAPRLS